MSLIVLTFSVKPVETDEGLYWPTDSNESLAGFEDWRWTVWGSGAAKQRGAVYLPRLAEQDLFVENAELLPFRAECETLLSDLTAFARDVKQSPDAVGERLQNVLKAIDRARLNGHGVYLG